MFSLQENPIDIESFKNRPNPNNGALVSFEGIVRADQHPEGLVSGLLYVADADICIPEGEKILHEASARFSITDAVCVQRIGQINVGETAVWIGVWAGHRDEACKACRYIIEEIKGRLVVWKKEFFNGK